MPPARFSGAMALSPGRAGFVVPSEGFGCDALGFGTADADIFQQPVVERAKGVPLTLVLGIILEFHDQASEESGPGFPRRAPCFKRAAGLDFELVWLHQHCCMTFYKKEEMRAQTELSRASCIMETNVYDLEHYSSL